MSETALLPAPPEALLDPVALQPAAVEEWQRITGGLLREMDNPDVQAALTPYCTTPISEDLPRDALAHLPETPLLRRLHESSTALDAYTNIPPVDESRIPRDIQYAWKKAGTITEDEFSMIEQRYIMARDIKLLALGAELQQVATTGEQLQPDETDTIHLPSGIELHGVSAAENSPNLFDPNKWQGREQLKDRVHIVTVDGQKYIMKEQKTERHTDTTEGGHQESHRIPPAREFEIGQKLNTPEAPPKGGIQVKWERPLGYVEYPDGFAFGMYEFEEGLVAEVEAESALFNNIFDQPEAFKDEFEACSADMQRFFDTPFVREAYDVRGPRFGAAIFGRANRTPKALRQPLDFRDFAAVKARQMMISSAYDQADVQIERNLHDADNDGTLYRVQPGKAELEIIGLDFERYVETSADEVVDRKAQQAESMAAIHEERKSNGADTGIAQSWRGRERAALLSLLEQSDPRWTSRQ
ncbi:MAG TPA: hypothetical protein VGO07_07680 [Candidatus Saccharimonadales bacterium]|jgi:hypothetical protein|nr:hypothetical protein [Candidatus Saccharimonadales bacterium]